VDDDETVLEPVGNSLKGRAKVRDDGINKLRQVTDGPSIVAFWSDNDEDIEEVEFWSAMQSLRRELESGIVGAPAGLLFATFASPWMDVRRARQIRCHPFQDLVGPFSKWTTDLESALVNHRIEAAIESLRQV
jgi:hypothetical protein